MRRTTPHKHVGFAWISEWYMRRPRKALHRGRMDERICWRYIELRRYLKRFGYLRSVPALIALVTDLILDWIFITQHKPYLPGIKKIIIFAHPNFHRLMCICKRAWRNPSFFVYLRPPVGTFPF